MRMNTQFTVSVQMLLLIMIKDSTKVTSGMIAQSTGCNPVMVRQLFGKLKQAGILNVSTGRGATELAREPTAISLWDVYVAVEGCGCYEQFKFHPQISTDCRVGNCFPSILSVHLDEAVRAMEEKLSAVSLAQLLEEWQATMEHDL